MNIIVIDSHRDQAVEIIKLCLDRKPDMIIFPEDFLTNLHQLEAIRKLNSDNVKLCGGVRLEHNEAIIIDGNEIVMQRPKAPVEGPLKNARYQNIGLMLCREIYLDFDSLKGCDLIVNPIGTGMFSEAQFDEWCERARFISNSCGNCIIGTCNSNLFYKNSDVSIPVKFIFHKGHEMYKSNIEKEAILYDTTTNKVTSITDIYQG